MVVVIILHIFIYIKSNYTTPQLFEIIWNIEVAFCHFCMGFFAAHNFSNYKFSPRIPISIFHLLKSISICKIIKYDIFYSVVCILVNPMWRYQQFNRKIGNILYKLCVTLKNFGHRFIILPSIAIYNIASYIFLLKWLPGNFINLLEINTADKGLYKGICNKCNNKWKK